MRRTIPKEPTPVAEEKSPEVWRGQIILLRGRIAHHCCRPSWHLPGHHRVGRWQQLWSLAVDALSSEPCTRVEDGTIRDFRVWRLSVPVMRLLVQDSRTNIGSEPGRHRKSQA